MPIRHDTKWHTLPNRMHKFNYWLIEQDDRNWWEIVTENERKKEKNRAAKKWSSKREISNRNKMLIEMQVVDGKEENAARVVVLLQTCEEKRGRVLYIATEIAAAAAESI